MIRGVLIIGISIFLLVMTTNKKNTVSINESKNMNNQYKEIESINNYHNFYLGVDYSNKTTINSDADYIAIVKIESLESSNWDFINKQCVSPYTKGDATVINVLKGNLPQTFQYRRLGAKISYSEWIKGDVDKEKIETIIGIPTNPDNVIIDDKKVDDIHLEVGKTYLVFMKQYECCNTEKEYTIIAFEYGARELQESINYQSKNSINSIENIKNLKVKNNITGEWEKISDIVSINSIQ